MVELPETTDRAHMFSSLAEAFEVEHERRFGHRSSEEPIQLVNLRVIGLVRGKDVARSISWERLGESLYGAGPKRASRSAYFGERLGRMETPVISRAELSQVPVQGPIIIEEYDTTILVPPNFRASRDTFWDVILEPA